MFSGNGTKYNNLHTFLRYNSYSKICLLVLTNKISNFHNNKNINSHFQHRLIYLTSCNCKSLKAVGSKLFEIIKFRNSILRFSLLP